MVKKVLQKKAQSKDWAKKQREKYGIKA